MKNTKSSFFERLTGSADARNKIEIDESIDFLEEEKIIATKQDDEAELAIDMYQTPTDIIIRTMVAGVKPDDLELSITRDTITIRGEREENRNIDEDNYFAKELYWGKFSRTFPLPMEVEPEEVDATERHGLVTIKIKKVDTSLQQSNWRSFVGNTGKYKR